MSSEGSHRPPSRLLELVEPTRWQRLQDHFARVLGFAIRTVAPSRELLVAPSWPAGLDPDRTVALLRLGEELDQLIPSQEPPGELTTLTTGLGVTYALVPIRPAGSEIVAYFVVGPTVLGTREDELAFRQRVGALRLDADALWSLLLSLRLYSFSGIRSVLGFMEDAAGSLVEFAYQARLAAAAAAQPWSDPAASAQRTTRVLESLLDVATIAAKADGGSVMLWDAQRQALRIRAAKGLSERVVAETALPFGQGIAGRALRDGAILLVDQTVMDPALRDRMTRAELVSSLVAPLTANHHGTPLGVLNLRTSDPQRRFTQEHVELLRRLLDLAGVALSHLTFSFTVPPAR